MISVQNKFDQVFRFFKSPGEGDLYHLAES
jgi:hypothetical protein